MNELKGFKVAVLATDGFEESELTKPVEELKKIGAEVHVIAPQAGKIQGFRHHDKSIQVDVDRTLAQAQPGEYDAVLLPGGALNADALRVVPSAQTFVRAMNDERKPIAVICHGPWLLVSAGVVRGHNLTSYHTIVDDIRNAGGEWTDSEVIVDGNLVSSRKPDDLPAFNREMIKLFSSSRGARKVA